LLPSAGSGQAGQAGQAENWNYNMGHGIWIWDNKYDNYNPLIKDPDSMNRMLVGHIFPLPFLTSVQVKSCL